MEVVNTAPAIINDDPSLGSNNKEKLVVGNV